MDRPKRQEPMRQPPLQMPYGGQPPQCHWSRSDPYALEMDGTEWRIVREGSVEQKLAVFAKYAEVFARATERKKLRVGNVNDERLIGNSTGVMQMLGSDRDRVVREVAHTVWKRLEAAAEVDGEDLTVAT